MSATRKLRRERDVARGRAYAHLLDSWITGRDRQGGNEPITALFDALVEHGRHNLVPKPDRSDGAQ